MTSRIDSTADFIDRLDRLGLSREQMIVIGGGVLALHGIRRAGDIDLVVTKRLFETLEEDTSWRRGKTGSASYSLLKKDADVWTDWSTDGTGHPDYNDLLAYTKTVKGVRCVTLDYLAKRKIERGSEKDKEDLRRIREYQGK